MEGMDYKSDEVTIDLMELVTQLWRHLPILLLSAILGAALGFGVSKFVLTPEYEATALMIVNTRQDTSANVTSDQINSATKLVETYSIIIKSDTVLQQVIDNLHLNMTYAQLSEKVSVAAVNSTQVMKVTVVDPSVSTAKAICEQITLLAPDLIVESVEAGSVKVISQAKGNADPVSPNVMRNTVVACLVAFMLCAGVIIVRMLLDNKINTEADVTKYLDLPVLGVIPDYEGGRK
jgi:capsular polysaccharide biosynthesis protein